MSLCKQGYAGKAAVKRLQTLIVVPARYGSTRFPGKPLAEINGVSMLRRTARIAELASAQIENCDYIVATDDERIQAHCEALQKLHRPQTVSPMSAS